MKLEVNIKDETVWLTQTQIAKLFDKDRTVITKHINNIFKEKEIMIELILNFLKYNNKDLNFNIRIFLEPKKLFKPL